MTEYTLDNENESNPNDNWFGKLLLHFLKVYREKVNAAYFLEKYPGLPSDAIVDRRIKSAQMAAAASGGTTGLANTALIAATIGSLGGASPLAVPATIVSIVADTAYVARLQLELAYDISVLYGYPLDFEDAEDLAVLLNLAFGIKVGEIFTRTLRGLAPEGTRLLVKNVASGATLGWLKALPVVGRYLLQRNIIKTAIPLVGIGLGTGMNYYLTGINGHRAKKIYRKRPSIFNVVNDFPLHKINDIGLLLDLIWLTISSDKDTSLEEDLLVIEVLNRLKKNGYDSDYEDFSKRVFFDKDKIFDCIAACTLEEKETLLKAVCLAAVVDGQLTTDELSFVREVALQLGIPFDEQALRELVKKF
jgi:hypothetical protein